MEFRTIDDADALPEEMSRLKDLHFREIFGRFWRDVHNQSPVLARGERVLMAEEGGRPAGWVHYRLRPYELKFRGFTVHPDFRGRGLARSLMDRLVETAAEHHRALVERGDKPDDVRLMFVSSLIYLEGTGRGEEFAFGRFLKRIGFGSFPYDRRRLDAEEIAAEKVYTKLRPGMAKNLRVFRLAAVDEGVTLKPEAQEELMRLTAEQRAVVMGGLEVKLGNFERSGRMSYRYDLCPICRDMGSTEKDSEPCGRCYIRVTCLEPFREGARFKEDYEVSAAYFGEMRRFLLEN